jgi:hypothetical protein
MLLKCVGTDDVSVAVQMWLESSIESDSPPWHLPALWTRMQPIYIREEYWGLFVLISGHRSLVTFVATSKKL